MLRLETQELGNNNNDDGGNMSPEKQRVVILGGGTAGWVTAAILSCRLKACAYDITVIDSAEIPTIGVGEASIPTLYDTLKLVGLTDADLVKKCQATFKYGIEFEGWSKPNEKYMHGFGTTGHHYQGIDFFDIWQSVAGHIKSHDLAPFTPTITAAYADKFSRGASYQSTDKNIFYPLNQICYALHFDASLLAKELRTIALANGATHESKNIVDTKLGNQGIAALIADDNTTYHADFFIDCSGMSGRLSRQALGAEFESWQHYLPCDRAIAIQTERVGTTPKLYTRSVANKAGWRWEIPLQHRTGNGIVYSSAHLTEEGAHAQLISEIRGKPLTEARHIHFNTGRLKKPWLKNCVAIGLSAGFLEPLESTSIHLICAYAKKLSDALSESNVSSSMQDRFNLGWQEETSEIRDFLMLHYIVNQRSEPFWQHCRSMSLTKNLEHFLPQLKNEGWIDLPKSTLFGHDSWFQVAIGQKYAFNYKKLSANTEYFKEKLNFLQNVAHAVACEVNAIKEGHAEVLKHLQNTNT